MTKLLFKDLTLAAHPTMYIFTLLGCLVIVPSYPMTVVFMFSCIAQYITFTYSRETNDNFFTAVLPVRKAEIVKSRYLLAVLSQTAQMVIALPFALLRGTVEIGNNPVGIDPNIAWYGAGFIIFAAFNLIFFPVYYKTGYKSGRAFITAMIPVLLLMTLTEATAHIPALNFLDGAAPENLIRQIPVLAAGIGLYVAATLVSLRISVKRFEKVDL